MPAVTTTDEFRRGVAMHARLTRNDLNCEHHRFGLGTPPNDAPSAYESRRPGSSWSDGADTGRLQGAILAAISHDVRNPLASIKAGATSLLSHEVEWDREATREFAAIIDEGADRLLTLVDGLLDLSRIRLGGLRPVIAPVAVEDIVLVAIATLGNLDDRLVLRVANDLPSVSADASLLERAFANVVANSLAWSSPHSPVQVEVGLSSTMLRSESSIRGPASRPRTGNGSSFPSSASIGLVHPRGSVSASPWHARSPRRTAAI